MDVYMTSIRPNGYLPFRVGTLFAHPTLRERDLKLYEELNKCLKVQITDYEDADEMFADE